MKASDIYKLLSSPFRRRTLSRQPELPAKMINSDMKGIDKQVDLAN
jgi:hypothetical protein